MTRQRPATSSDTLKGLHLEKPLVSIITPSLNQGQYLSDTLESVSEQTYSNIEHIVMDGGSSDNSVDLLRDWAGTHAIEWHSGHDDGQADAIQRGIALARGELIAWLNSDDVYLDRTAISTAVSYFVQGASVITGGGRYLSEAGSQLSRIPVRAERLDHRTLRCCDWVLQPATFIRRDLLQLCPLDTTLHYAFDWDLFIRLSALTKFTPVESEWAGYRLHDRGKTISGGSHRRRELLKMIAKYHGKSGRYAMMKLMDLGLRSADRLPELPRRATRRFINVVADISNKLTNGRGFQV